MKKYQVIVAAAALALSLSAQDYYEKMVAFPSDATLEQKVDMASRLVPTAKQMAWQDMELTAFLHFGINTFTDREWGDGTEDPTLFNPTQLDTDQWAKALSDAGFAMAMLTAKHHDGFCLWPTATTSHSVAASPWLDGQGDVVARLAESCRKYGLKLGLYLSPWDRNAPCYGDSPAYNDMFVMQLTELLTRYGQVDEVWFDGACAEGPNGRRQEYDWQRYQSVIAELQPNAVVAIMGDDVRWVGNEKGLGRETEWSATAFVPAGLPYAADENARLGLYNKAADLGSRQVLERAAALYWWPSEVDVSIRPGWFWHPLEQPRSLRELAEIYVNSVGRNSVLLLNIPPDSRGRLADADVRRLAELRQWIDANFSESATLPAQVNTVVLAEGITRGQRVEAFEVEALVDGRWISVAQGTTIGKKRILMFDPVEASDIRVNITGQRGEPHVNMLGSYMVRLPEYEADSLPEGYAYAPGWSDTQADGMSLTTQTSAPALICGVEYTPGQDAIVYTYRLYTSIDGKEWVRQKASGEMSNIMHNPLPQRIWLEQPIEATYVRLEALTLTGAGGVEPSSATPDVTPLRPIKAE